MKLIRNWRNKWRIKFKSRIRKEYRKQADDKAEKKIQLNEIENERALTEKDKEIQKLHEHYKTEINTVRAQTENYWKNLLTERDDRIEILENDRLMRRESIVRFEQMVQDFETQFTGTRIEIQAAGEYVKKAQQKILTGSGTWEGFFTKYRKDFPKIKDQIKEE